MSQFTKPLIVEVLTKNKFKIVESFEYHIGKYPSDETVIVPIGFVTDFASVPRIFWTLVSPIDSHAKAAVLHDFLYNIGYKTRKECDEIFYESMKVLGVSKYKALIMFKAVRVFGFPFYKKRI